MSCSTDLDVFSEAREAYVVYGILNPAQDTQFVKISRVFQTDGDAVLYAQENDPTTRGLLVTLSMDTMVLQATEVTYIRRDSGIFIPGQVIYAIPTSGTHSLAPGATYTLNIRKADDPGFLISATTTVPDKPEINGPKGPYSGLGGVFTWPSVDFETDQSIEFEKGNAHAWEVRIGFFYTRNGVPDHSAQKNIGIILPEENCLSGSSNEMCYKVPGASFPRFILAVTSRSDVPIIYSEEPHVPHSIDSLPKVCYIEVTSIDQQLTTFLYANEPGPFGLNLLMDKQEFSNITGDNYGIFGSINVDTSWIYMSACTQYLGGLSTAQPLGCTF